MYLETILVLSQRKGQVRSVDVARETGYAKPSVSRAVGLLKQKQLILVDENGFLTLTETGYAAAQKVLERHRVLTEFLCRIGVDGEVAAEDACRMEHDISDETIECLKKHLATWKN